MVEGRGEITDYVLSPSGVPYETRGLPTAFDVDGRIRDLGGTGDITAVMYGVATGQRALPNSRLSGAW